jgi:hypothetical protein
MFKDGTIDFDWPGGHEVLVSLAIIDGYGTALAATKMLAAAKLAVPLV